jgi:hypothetical protein
MKHKLFALCVLLSCASALADEITVPDTSENATSADVGNYSYATEEGKSYILAINFISPEVGQVINDLSVAYQAKCGAPVLISTLRSMLKDPQYSKAVAISADQKNIAKSCSEKSERCNDSMHHADYMDVVTHVICTPSQSIESLSAIEVGKILDGMYEVAVDYPSTENIAALNLWKKIIFDRAELAVKQCNQADKSKDVINACVTRVIDGKAGYSL